MYWYHAETKHSYYSVRSNPNAMDWALQPSTYKNYPNFFEKLELDSNNPWHGIIYYAASISTKKYYPTGTHRFLRVNPSAGALYPNELYFQARGIEGFEDGVYHYEVETNRAVLLYRLKEGEGIEPYMGYETAMKGLLFLVSAVYYRSSWKYRNRAFRYCLLDAGHMLGSLESSALLMDENMTMVYDLKRRRLNEMFGFSSREYFLSGAGYLCLEQYSLGMAGAMTFFLLSSAKNYQALYQKAGIIGQRLYAISSYLDIGCSGIGAYYDDEVNALVEQEGMVLYALAIGR